MTIFLQSGRQRFCTGFVANGSRKQQRVSFLRHQPWHSPRHTIDSFQHAARGIRSFSLLQQCLDRRQFMTGGLLLAHNNNNSNSNNSKVQVRQERNLRIVASDATCSLSKFASWSPKFDLDHVEENVLELKEGQRLVCVGDVHGDFDALQNFLTLAGVYNTDDDKWVGGNTILVQCGDVLDRGVQELQCCQLLSRLSREARAAGGRVVVLWGNHEVLNAAGMFQYTINDGEYEATLGTVLDKELHSNRWRLQFVGNQPSRWAAHEPGGLLAVPLMAQLKVAIQVGKTLCVHGGLSTQHLNHYQNNVGAMNHEARNWILSKFHERNNNFGLYKSVDEAVADANQRYNATIASIPFCLSGGIGSNSPVWMRDYSSPCDAPPSNPVQTQALIDETLDRIQADRMVVGHTVQKRINAALKGKIWRIDVGASRGVMAGTPEVLEVVKNKEGQEVVSILTKNGRIPSAERQVDDARLMLD